MKGLYKKFGKIDFLHDINFSICGEDRLGILGENGSGKSTLMSIVAGVNTFDKGEVLYNGQANASKVNIGYVPQEPVLLQGLSVKDNLRLWQGVYHIKCFDEVVERIPHFLGVHTFLSKKTEELSGGMKKKVAIAICFLNNPKLVILDEPFAALDEDAIVCMNEYLNSLEDVAILYSSHDKSELMKVCKRYIVMKNGKIIS